MKHFRLFAIIALFALFTNNEVRAQHQVQVDDGSGHYSLLKGQTVDALDIFMFPVGGGTLLTDGGGGPAPAWMAVGNILSGGTPATPAQFFGSTNNYDVIFKTAGNERMRMTATGFIGIGQSNPSTLLANVPSGTNIVGANGDGETGNSLSWMINTNGYVAAFWNSDATTNSRNGVEIKVASNGIQSMALDVSQQTAAGVAGVPLFNVRANGDVSMTSSAGDVSIGRAASSTNVTGTMQLVGTTSPLSMNGAVGNSGQVLTSAGTGATPTWSTVGTSSITPGGTNTFLTTNGSSTVGWTGLSVGTGLTGNGISTPVDANIQHNASLSGAGTTASNLVLNVANPNTWTGTQTLGGEALTPVTPASLVANTNDYALSASNSYFRISSTGAINLTGITGGIAGRMITISNVGANTITLKSQQGSAAANQFDLPAGADIIMGPKATVSLIYDGTLGFWEIVSTN
ncbi:MAG: hypothetical protein Q8916_02460 [Bacteroidota bacterium]|nr:hypothetical protein [Bacteroidota bacterium]MDP4229249.1 hypothetical protein [Bacteroidota bacterium]MDP4235535.1 hypothetical protein [Bacteroidota bacterium]